MTVSQPTESRRMLSTARAPRWHGCGNLPQKKERLSPAEFEKRTEPVSDDDYENQEVEDLSEPWPFTFLPNESVWVAVDDGVSRTWVQGRVSSSNRVLLGWTERGIQSLFFTVQTDKTRLPYAPLDGTIKPDIPSVRALLSQEYEEYEDLE